MTYKRQLTVLSILTALLALVYAAALIFDPERVNVRSASFSWLADDGDKRADRVEVTSARGEPVVMVRKNGLWVIPAPAAGGELDLPVKQGRLDDLFGILSSRGSYPVRAKAPASHGTLGLTEDLAARILIRGGAGAYPLLDLLVGNPDATGREVYLRKNGQNEVRSGDNRLASYVDGSSTSWYNLRLFPETAAGPLTLDMVQGVTVEYPPGYPARRLVLARGGGGWTADGAETDIQKAETYVRSIVEAEGDDFILTMEPGDPRLDEGRITLQLGDGTVRTIRIGPAGEDKRRAAAVSGAPCVYALTEWTANRILREPSSFAAQ